jgi:hypothetical protein
MLTEGSIQIGALVLPSILKAGGRLFAQSRAPVAPTGQQRCFPNCFPAGTWIATEQGLRPIETIQASDRVWAFDLVAGKWRLCFVVETYAYEHDGDLVTLTVADEAIEATGKHPFWVVEGQGLERRPRAEHVPETPWGAKIPGRWVDAGDLQVGDVLLLRSGRPVAVTRLAVRHVRQQVYNFQVEELHCYAVGVSQVLVHNNCGEGAPTLPEYIAGGKTSGILRTATGDTPLISGYKGPSASMPKGTPGMNNIIKSHVEAHAAALMRQQGISEAILYINRIPCSGKTGCDAMLPLMLPEGAKLTVIGPNEFIKTYMGLPD